ncbi:hypothetical protein FQA39_LY18267 [Lamprigera yunnana]|nr:hypothetical protein FQA39_LY18267 [Lamprigera yunnana]
MQNRESGDIVNSDLTMLVETIKVQCEETAKSSDKMDLFVMKLREINNVEIKIKAEVDQRVISIDTKVRDEANFEKAKEKWEINRTRVNDNIGRLNTNDRQLNSKVTEVDNKLKEEIASLEYKIESTKREPIPSCTKISSIVQVMEETGELLKKCTTGEIRNDEFSNGIIRRRRTDMGRKIYRCME